MLRAILAASVLAAAAFSAAGAHAQDTQSTSVSTRDVAFNKPADVKQLYGRIRDAAYAVCDSQGPTTLFTAARERECADTATRNAVHDLDKPLLNEVAQGRPGRDSQMAMRDHRDEDRTGTR